MSDRLCTSHFSVQYTRTQKCLNFGYFIERVFHRRRPLYWDAGAWIGMIKQAHTIQYTMSITTLKRERAAYICHQHLTISQECSKNKTFTSVLSLLSGAYLRSFILFCHFRTFCSGGYLSPFKNLYKLSNHSMSISAAGPLLLFVGCWQ